MKIMFLIPPSEGKNAGGILGEEKLGFPFKKPHKIATHASEKDLKCKGKRYEEGIKLNKNIKSSNMLPAIERYSGVMYSAISYENMSRSGKEYFEENFFILSGMYGILRPQDSIGNYKLPIETKGLYTFWGDIIVQKLNELGIDIIVDFLPNSYKKMIDWKKLNAKVLQVEFYKKTLPFAKGVPEGGGIIKLTHGVKKVKGGYIKNICENGFTDVPDFGDMQEKVIPIIIS